jgi:polyisoprenoid-binding protein YceI
MFSQGNVSFVIKNAGFSVDGFFEKVKMEVIFNKKNPENSKFFGEVETSSINTDNNKRDKHLREKDYFYCEMYPIMKFVSSGVKVLNSNQLSVTGNLTIRDVTKLITIPVDISKADGKDVFTSTFKLKRRDYNVGGWSLILSDDLKVTIRY